MITISRLHRDQRRQCVAMNGTYKVANVMWRDSYISGPLVAVALLCEYAFVCTHAYLYGTSQLDRTPNRRKYPHRQCLGFVVRRTILLWTHNQSLRVRAGEVRDPGEVIGKRRRGRPNTPYSSNITQNGCMRAWSESRGTHWIALNGEDWYDVRDRRLIINHP